MIRETEILRGLHKARAKFAQRAQHYADGTTNVQAKKDTLEGAPLASRLADASAEVGGRGIASANQIGKGNLSAKYLPFALGDTMAGFAGGGAAVIGGTVEKGIRGAAKQFARGTPFVRGQRGRDKVPAMLTHGEAVLPVNTVNAVGRQNIARMIADTNNGTAPQIGLRAGAGYADGFIGNAWEGVKNAAGTAADAIKNFSVSGPKTNVQASVPDAAPAQPYAEGANMRPAIPGVGGAPETPVASAAPLRAGAPTADAPTYGGQAAEDVPAYLRQQTPSDFVKQAGKATGADAEVGWNAAEDAARLRGAAPEQIEAIKAHNLRAARPVAKAIPNELMQDPAMPPRINNVAADPAAAVTSAAKPSGIWGKTKAGLKWLGDAAVGVDIGANAINSGKGGGAIQYAPSDEQLKNPLGSALRAGAMNIGDAGAGVFDDLVTGIPNHFLPANKQLPSLQQGWRSMLQSAYAPGGSMDAAGRVTLRDDTPAASAAAPSAAPPAAQPSPQDAVDAAQKAATENAQQVTGLDRFATRGAKNSGAIVGDGASGARAIRTNAGLRNTLNTRNELQGNPTRYSTDPTDGQLSVTGVGTKENNYGNNGQFTSGLGGDQIAANGGGLRTGGRNFAGDPVSGGGSDGGGMAPIAGSAGMIGLGRSAGQARERHFQQEMGLRRQQMQYTHELALAQLHREQDKEAGTELKEQVASWPEHAEAAAGKSGDEAKYAHDASVGAAMARVNSSPLYDSTPGSPYNGKTYNVIARTDPARAKALLEQGHTANRLNDLMQKANSSNAFSKAESMKMPEIEGVDGANWSDWLGGMSLTDLANTKFNPLKSGQVLHLNGNRTLAASHLANDPDLRAFVVGQLKQKKQSLSSPLERAAGR